MINICGMTKPSDDLVGQMFAFVACLAHHDGPVVVAIGHVHMQHGGDGTYLGTIHCGVVEMLVIRLRGFFGIRFQFAVPRQQLAPVVITL